MMEDCQKKKKGSWETASSQVLAEAEGQGKGGKGKKGASSLDEWPDGVEAQPPDEKAIEEVAGLLLVLSADTSGTVNETGKPRKESRNRHEISGNPTRVETFDG